MAALATLPVESRFGVPQGQTNRVELPMRGLLTPSDHDFLRQMSNLDFKFDISPDGRLISELCWPTKEKDFSYLDQIMRLLSRADHSDESIREFVRKVEGGDDSIEANLSASPLFSRLDNRILLPKQSKTSLEHVLRVMEILQTDEWPPYFKVLLRHFAMLHDIGGKAINPTHPSHGLGSALIAEEYYRWANEQAGYEIYPGSFSLNVAYLCRTHHVFTELGGMLRAKMEERREQGNCSVLASLNLNDAEALADYLQSNFESEVEGGQTIDAKKFNIILGPYLENPALILVAGEFVRADVLAGQSYSQFMWLNLTLCFILASQATNGRLHLN